MEIKQNKQLASGIPIQSTRKVGLKFVLGTIVAVLLVFSSCHKPAPDEFETNEWFSGGKQTVWDAGAGAFSAMFPVIDERNEFIHEVGDVAFEQTFVSAGNINPGLGPVFNSVSCASCHINDGRGTPIGPGPNVVSLLFRMSIPGENEHGGPLAAPGYGGQLQQNSIAGADGEADIAINYTEQQFQFADGETYSLQYPAYTFNSPYTAIPAGSMYSPRIAPAVFGLGLLEAVSETEILAYEDAGDSDADGISGKANYAWDVVNNKQVLGRFGWKCAAPTLLQQTAGAYSEDMGITNFVFPMESCFGQPQCLSESVAEPELSDSLLHAATFYIATLGVPARRNADDEEVLLGKKIFHDAGCASCHRPMMRTATNVAFPEVSNQVIFPYSDMLLHDMGDDLADYRPDFLATGTEWRTPPLWGIGLTDVVNGHDNFLHDGRAKSLLEAIMWHGGEGAASREYVRNLSATDRNQLILFLESL